MRVLNDHNGEADGRIKLDAAEAKIITKALVAYLASSGDGDALKLARDMAAFSNLMNDGKTRKRPEAF
jgi:hypothetical protein